MQKPLNFFYSDLDKENTIHSLQDEKSPKDFMLLFLKGFITCFAKVGSFTFSKVVIINYPLTYSPMGTKL